MKKETYKLIARRNPPGDKWVLTDDDTNIIHPSLTETLEAYYQTVNTPYDFKLSPLKGELYIITTEDVPPPPPPPVKKFNIYGDL